MSPTGDDLSCWQKFTHQGTTPQMFMLTNSQSLIFLSLFYAKTRTAATCYIHLITNGTVSRQVAFWDCCCCHDLECLCAVHCVVLLIMCTSPHEEPDKHWPAVQPRTPAARVKATYESPCLPACLPTDAWLRVGREGRVVRLESSSSASPPT